MKRELIVKLVLNDTIQALNAKAFAKSLKHESIIQNILNYIKHTPYT